MQYFKFDKKELDKILVLKPEMWNNWCNSHLYSTCAACGKEYPYFESPILRNEIWSEVLNYFNLQEKQKEVELKRREKVLQIYSLLNSKKISLQSYRRRHLLSRYENCTICRNCMEIALGRKLIQNDLTKCLMNETIKIRED